MNKNTFKFEVSFNLNLADGEELDTTSMRAFKNQLFNFVQEWNGYHGHFYAFGSDYGDRDVNPTAIKVKKVS
jgi:hypothetical protein